MRPVLLLLTLLTPIALAGCDKTLDAPTDPGVCWHLVKESGGAVKFNRLADHQPDLEHCAAQLAMMRQRFQALGQMQSEVVGAYQGQFLFLDRTGVSTAQTYDGFRYPFMVPTGDGRLAVPGAMPESK